MSPKESKISKQAVASTTRHKTLTIPDTLGIIMKPGSATSQSIIIDTARLYYRPSYIIKKHKENIMCKYLDRQR